MSLNAVFAADFSKFFSAVDQATIKLKTFEEGAYRVGPALDKMVDQFSGRQVIEQAALMVRAIEEIGGVGALTETELRRAGDVAAEAAEKMTKLGMAVPENLQKIAAAATPVKSVFADIGSQIMATAAGMVSAQAIIGTVTGGIKAVGAFLGDSVKEFAEAEAASSKLTTALKLQGQATPEVTAQYAALGQSIQQTTIYQDDLITESEAMLAQIGGVLPGQMNAAITATTDLASALGIDLQQATLMVAKAAAGHTEALGRYGIEVDNADGTTKGFDATLAAINEKFGGQAAAQLDTYAGRVAQLDNKWGDFKETIGRFLVSSPLVEQWLRNTSDAMDGLNTNTGDATHSWSEFIHNLTGGFGGYDKLVRRLEDSADRTNTLARASRDLAAMPSPFAQMAKDAADLKLPNPNTLVDPLQSRLDELRIKTFMPLTESQKASIAELTKFGEKARDIAPLVHASEEAVNHYQDALKKQGQEAKDAAEKNTKFQESISRLPGSIMAIVPTVQTASDEIRTISDNLGAGLNADGTLVVETYEKIAGKLQDMGPAASTGVAAVRQAMGETKDLGTMLEGNLANIPDILIAAFTGGGGVEGAIKAIAVDFGKTFATHLTASIKENVAAGGSGATAAGMKAAGLGGAVAGVTAVASGASLGQATKGMASLAATTATMASTMGASVGASVALGAATMGIGTAAVFAAYGIKKLLSDPEKQINPIREGFVQAAGGLETLNQKAYNAGVTLDSLLAAKNKDQLQGAVDGLNAAFEAQKGTMDLLVETAEKYGFTLEELGPALQRQQLDETAQQLYQDFSLLNSAGIESAAITARMSDAVNAYVGDALRMGAEVPMAMRPMLESMVKAGELTDANGEKITDLEGSGISFSMTMSEGFKALITSVDKLATVISRNLGTAISDTTYAIGKIPRQVGIEVSYTERNRPSSAATPAESYAEGTDGFRNFGAGTPVMLHGWEAVVPRTKASTAGAALGEGGGATIVINAQGAFFDTPGDLQRLADKVNEALTAKFGLKNSMRAA
jgi:hypothetical protein